MLNIVAHQRRNGIHQQRREHTMDWALNRAQEQVQQQSIKSREARAQKVVQIVVVDMLINGWQRTVQNQVAMIGLHH